MRVIIAEKPDMGVKISEALGIKRKQKGSILLQNNDVVTWAFGHLIRLKEPDSYEEYKKWTFESLPILPKVMETEVNPDAKDQFKIIRDLLSEASSVVIATDPGREGEHIARLILTKAKYKGPIERLWIQDLTAATIQKGFSHLRPGADYDNLAAAAELRSYADYWIGFTATRFFTLAANSGTVLSAGRVQTPTLKLVYDREMEIIQFKDSEFYKIKASFETKNGVYDAFWYTMDQEERTDRFTTKEETNQFIEQLQSQPSKLISVNRKDVKRYAPSLLDSTAIKTTGRKYLGFDMEKTDKILQKLYDQGYVTYPRTASSHLTENVAEQLYVSLQNIQKSEAYVSLFPPSYSVLSEKRFVDNSKALEHHAIIPTGKVPKDLGQDEMGLYKWILIFTLAAHYPPGIDKEIKVITCIGDHTFETKQTVIVEPGFRKLIKEENGESSINEALANLQETDLVKTKTLQLHIGKASKPKRYLEDELVKAMEKAGKKLDKDDEAYDLMKEIGIGTPATRPGIIRELKKRGYIESVKHIVHLTDKGKAIMKIVKDHLIASVQLTAMFETMLNDVSEGVVTKEVASKHFIQFVYDLIKQKDEVAKAAAQLGFTNDLAICSCPSCGKAIVKKKNFYGCEGYKEGCKVSFPIQFGSLKLTDAMIKHLCNKKKMLVQFEGKKGKYERLLSYDGEKLVIDEPTAEDLSLGKCKLCGSPVIDKNTVYGCSNFKNGCSFKIPKVLLGVEIKPGQAKKILKSGSDRIEGFTHNGTTFNAKILYNTETKKFDFKK